MKPTLSDILQNAIEFFIEKMHTATVGIIETYDAAKQKASVKPAISKKYKTFDEKKQKLAEHNIEMPVLEDVPVIFPRSKHFSSTFPLEKGDQVLLLFCERALERWLADGGLTENGVPRRYDLKDAIAIPGVYHFNAETITEGENAAIKFHDLKILMTPESKIAISNDSIELINWLYSLVDEIENITVGGQPIDNIAAFTTLKNQLSNLKT